MMNASYFYWCAILFQGLNFQIFTYLEGIYNIFIQFLWIECVESFRLYVDRFLLSLIVSEMNLTKSRKKCQIVHPCPSIHLFCPTFSYSFQGRSMYTCAKNVNIIMFFISFKTVRGVRQTKHYAYMYLQNCTKKYQVQEPVILHKLKNIKILIISTHLVYVQISCKIKNNKGNEKRGISPRLKIWPGDLDLENQ